MDNRIQENGNKANHAADFLAGLVIGGLAGTAVMLLLVPQSGKKTRAQIQQKGIELREQASEIAETVGDAVEQANTKAHEVTTDIREKASELQRLGQDIFNRQKEQVAALVEGG
jgi:gas vesicle protein